MCPRINDTAFTPPRGFHYGTYSQQTNRHHPHLYKPGTTPCGLPRFPCPSAPPPDPYGPVLRGLPGRGRPSGGRAPGPDGIRRLAPGPVVMESPPDSTACERTAPRSSNPDPLGPAIGTRLNGYERIWGGKGGGRGRNGWMPERIRTGEYE